MNKSQSRYVLGILLVLLMILIACFAKFKSNLLGLNNFLFSVALLVMAILIIITVVHLIMHTSQGVAIVSQNEELHIEEGEQFIIFISCDPEKLSKIDAGSNIIKLTGSRVGRKVFFFDIKQNCGFLPSKRFRLQKGVYNNHEILFSDKDLAKINTSGIAIIVKGKVSSLLTLIEYVDKKNDIMYPEIKEDGTVLLKYRYAGIATTIKDLKLFLQDTKSIIVDSILPEIKSEIISESRVFDGEIILSIYSILLWDVFRSFPCNAISTDEKRKMWLDGNDGKIALFLLKNFSLSSMTGYDEVCLPNSRTAKVLNDKIKWVEDHMENCRTIESEKILTHIFDRIKNVLHNLDTRIYSYSFLYSAKDCCVNSYGKLEDLIRSNLSVHPYKYIFALASCQYRGDNATMSNNFIHKLLRAENFGELIDTVQSVLDNGFFDRVIKGDMSYYHALKIPDVLKELSINNDKKDYSFGDLVNHAREYIMKKCVVNNLPLVSKDSVSKKIGCVEGIVLFSEKKVCMKKNDIEVNGFAKSVMTATI